MAESISHQAKTITTQILHEAKNYRQAIHEFREVSEITKIHERIGKLVNQINNLYPEKKKKKRA